MENATFVCGAFSVIPDEGPVLTDGAIYLLLTLLEQLQPVMSGAAVEDFHLEAARGLLAAGLLKTDGHEVVAAAEEDGDGSPVSLTWCAEKNAYGYFGRVGWVLVPEERLRLYRADIPKALETMTLNLHRPVRRPITALLADMVWDLGDIRLKGRTHTVSVWFARRLFDVHAWRNLRDRAAARPPSNSRLLLTTTPVALLSDEPLPSTSTLAIEDCLRFDGGVSLDPALLAAHLDGGVISRNSESLRVIGDAREVHFRGQTYTFPRGDKQRRIIVYLHKQLQAHRSAVSAAEIIAALDLGEQTRIRDVFKKNAAWGTLLTESGGMVRFCL